jgi:hypothetical protein
MFKAHISPLWCFERTLAKEIGRVKSLYKITGLCKGLGVQSTVAEFVFCLCDQWLETTKKVDRPIVIDYYKYALISVMIKYEIIEIFDSKLQVKRLP